MCFKCLPLLSDVFLKVATDVAFNHLITTLKRKATAIHTVTGTLAVDGRAITFWYSEALLAPGEAWAACGPTQSLLTVPNVTVIVPTSYYSMWHYNCL